MRILSLDGGVCAALHLRLLHHLERRRPGFLARTELMAGSSDGALMLLYLAPRLGPDSSENLRALEGCIAYFHELLGALQLRPGTLARFALGRGPAYIEAQFRNIFTRHLGTETLGGLEQRGRKLLVMVLERRTWKRRTFRSFGLQSEAERGRSLVDVALACSAFPVVRPPYRSEVDGLEYLDGALVTNNPSLVALREALALRVLQGGGGPDKLDELSLLSLGGTENSEAGSTAQRHGGVLSWLPGTLDRLGFAGWSQLLARHVYLPDFMLQGSVDILDLQCADLLGPRYHRVRPLIPELDYIASTALPPEYLRRRLDAHAADWLREEPPELLRWLDAQWMVDPRADGTTRARSRQEAPTR